MSYVIVAKCLGEQYAQCVEVCPVDCIYPGDHNGEKFMVIDPEICITCGACLRFVLNFFSQKIKNLFYFMRSFGVSSIINKLAIYLIDCYPLLDVSVSYSILNT